MNPYTILLISCWLLPYTTATPTTTERTKRQRLPRIVNGERDGETVTTQSKYLVSIRSRTPKEFFGDNHYCAGVFISRQHILTAARCVLDNRKVMHAARDMLVVAGTTNRLIIKSTTVQFKVNWMVAHLNFTLYNTNDLAIIHLRKPAPFNALIRISTLAKEPPPYGEKCLVAGWGRMYENGPLGAMAVHASVDLLPRDVCESHLSVFTPDMICAGNKDFNSHTGPCEGDTGGPLVCKDQVFGIISHTISCSDMKKPSVYTNVYTHIDWIESVLNSAAMPWRHQMIIFMFIFAAYLNIKFRN